MGNTELSIISLYSNLIFGGVESKNLHPNLVLSAGAGDGEVSDEARSSTQPDVCFFHPIFYLSNLVYPGLDRATIYPGSDRAVLTLHIKSCHIKHDHKLNHAPSYATTTRSLPEHPFGSRVL